MTDADLIEQFISTRRVSERTRSAYKGDLVRFSRWCEGEGLTLRAIGPADIARLRDTRRRAGAATNSIHRQILTMSQFFRWLLSEKIIESNPLPNPVPLQPVFPVRDTLTVQELRKVWQACTTPTEAAAIGLLGINALRVDEVTAADVSDLAIEDGLHVLHIQALTSAQVRPFTVLAAEVHDQIRLMIGARRAGPLFLGSDGERLTRQAIFRTVVRIAKKAGIPFRVTPITLSFSMRPIAIERGFSYVSMVRAAGVIDGRRLPRWIAVAGNPVREHAALRLARLVVADPQSAETILSQASTVLSDTDAPPATAVMLAGAAFEQHLRRLMAQHNVANSKSERDSQIGTYVALLTGAKVLSKADNQLAISIAQYRDTAAHGWFDEVSIADAHRILRAVELLIRKYPCKV